MFIVKIQKDNRLSKNWPIMWKKLKVSESLLYHGEETKVVTRARENATKESTANLVVTPKILYFFKFIYLFYVSAL